MAVKPTFSLLFKYLREEAIVKCLTIPFKLFYIIIKRDLV